MADSLEPISYTMTGSGENLLLVHGGTGSRQHWQRNIDTLAQEYCVWAIDLPGFGDSADVPAEIDSSGYIAYVFEQLRTLPFMDSPLLMAAFSFGSVIASGLAVKMGAQLKKISLVGPAGFGIKRAVPIETRSMRSAGDSVQAQEEVMRHNLRAIMLYYPESITAEMLALHRIHIKKTRFDSRPLSLSPLLLNNLKQLKCPIQIMWGEHDQYAHPMLDARIALTREALPSALIQKIERAGHWAQYENAQETNRLLLAFLKSV